MKHKELYIGVMSGTSLDGIDIALVNLANDQFELLDSFTADYPLGLLENLAALANSDNDSINLLAETDRTVGQCFAKAINKILDKNKIESHQILAIGSHGHTVRHKPNKDNLGFSLQIGDPNSIAELTNINVIADFRRRDIAAGGEGAPLVPAFHQAAFADNIKKRVVVNIGGIANITILNPHKPVQGFDTGPGNRLMDFWIHLHQGTNFDNNGDWASKGQINTELLATLIGDPYFQLKPPKSTGREYFNADWLETKLNPYSSIENSSIQTTLCELTATSISHAIKTYAHDNEEIFICGGGAYNQYLMQRLENLNKSQTVHSSKELGIEPSWVEAIAFAWLAKQYLQDKTGNETGVTGAKHPRILGALYKA